MDDHHKITEVLVRYATGIDSRDWKLFRTCFTDDAHFDYGYLGTFENPDKLDVQRENARRHIAFGYGIHRCVGARLAELQLRVLLEELHKRRMRVHLAGDIERVKANFVHGFRKLEVEITEF